MLDFFRRHQRYFFVVITIVIVISFSFFGTYSSLSNGSFREQIAFRTINGTDITRHELDEMVSFISTDATDKLIFGSVWGPNFFNDGVIAKDFLQTGLGVVLATSYPNDISLDLSSRLEKEKRYSLYVHPEARFIGVESAWNYFSPRMGEFYRELKGAENPVDPSILRARASLYLMERQFPQSILRQVLRYQEKQNSFVNPDRNLEYADLSLFGYHTLEDWFGPRFLRLSAEFIINAAEIAENQGYKVSKADAIADLIRNSEKSFQQNSRSPNIGVANSQDYYNEQLRRLGLDQTKAANLWRQVMLFRRLFNDMGSSVFVDSLTYQKVNDYALEAVDGELYRLPKELHLKDFSALQKFEAYIDAVAKKNDGDKTKLTLPSNFRSASDVATNYPELIYKRYVLEMTSASKKALEAKVSVKDTWDFEVSDSGFAQLIKQFPELKDKKSSNRDERFASLDALNPKTRAKVDAFARENIVNNHPEWLEKALSESTPMNVTVKLHEKGGASLITGLSDGKELMKLLDAAPVAAEEVKSNSQMEESLNKLANFTADKTVYYRIRVLERANQPEILTFKEADEEGVLSKLVDKQLESYYKKIREDDSKEFQNDNKTWKPLSDVKEVVAKRYYAKLLNNIREAYLSKNSQKANEEMIPDFAATLRLYPYMVEMKDKLKNNPDLIAKMTRQIDASKSDGENTLLNQWKLERSDYQASRSSGSNILDVNRIFTLANGDWTEVNAPGNGDINFYQLKMKKEGASETAVIAMVDNVRNILANDAEQKLMFSLLKQIKDKDAISLNYMNQKIESEE